VRRPGLGTLAPGAPAEASVIEERAGTFEYVDATGERLVGGRRLVALGRVREGCWYDGPRAGEGPS
jgi:dihydroorotase